MVSSLRRILTNYILLVAFVILVVASSWVNAAIAVEIDPDTRTVPLNASGEQIMLTTKQLAVGQRKFNSSCAQCHLDGGTKTNPDVDLSSRTLALATPPRDNVEGIVDYLENPVTYDGSESIAELHPSTKRSDIFPKMRDLTNEDLRAIAGYILVQPKVVGEQWGGGKPKR